MCDYARGIDAVHKELVTAGLEIDVDAFDSFDEDLEWVSKLQCGENGVIKPTFHNAWIIVSHDPKIKNLMRKNQFSMKVENSKTGENWLDLDSVNVRIDIGKQYKVDFPEKKVEDAISIQAETNCYHPVCNYLESLTWDRVERIETLFIDYMGSEDTLYLREISKCWFTAAVNRVFHPGYKFDSAIVLGGAQGIGKTRFIRELGLQKWYGELSSFDPKIAMEETGGKWIIEINEMGATNRQELETQKSFLSAQHTTVRMAYAHHAYDFKRQCIFMGSTNAVEYLKDSTGNRRWWPVDCHVKKIDIEKLHGEVDQIWAEAYMLYAQGAKTYLTDEVKEQAEIIQESKKDSNPAEGIIWEWLELDAEKDRYELQKNQFGGDLEARDKVCVIEVWQDCLDRKDKPRPHEGKEIGVILSKNPLWEKGLTGRFGVRFGAQKMWKKVCPF